MTNRKDKCIARRKHPSASVPARQVIALAFEWTHLSMASVNPDSWNNKSAKQQVCQVVHRLRPWWFACRGVLYYLERASMTTTDAFCLFVPHGLSFVCPWQLRKHEGFPLFSQVQSLTIARHLLSDWKWTHRVGEIFPISTSARFCCNEHLYSVANWQKISVLYFLL